MNRNLDGIYFRVERNGKWQNICYSDLTYDERDSVTNGRSGQWWRSLANHLADSLKEIGDEFDIVRKEE